MELRHLLTFRTVVSTGSFTRAAAALNYVQPNVTAQIRALETELGVQLFDRIGQRIQLTEAGHRLVRHADRILALVDETAAVVTSDDQLTGTVTISAPETISSYYLPQLLAELAEKCPCITVAFYQGGRGSAALRQQAQDGVVDVAFVLDEPIHQSGLAVEALAPMPIVLVARPNHALAPMPEVSSSALAASSLIVPDIGCSYRNVFGRLLDLAGVYPTHMREISNIETIKRFALAGLGIALLPAVAVEAEIASGQLCEIAWNTRPIQVECQALWHRAKWLSPATRRFLEVTRTVFAQCPASV